MAGYSDRLVDQQVLAVQIGYWAAYYTNAKHAKSINEVSEKIIRSHKKETSAARNKPKAEVDVEAFLATERRFKEALKAGQVISNGRD